MTTIINFSLISMEEDALPSDTDQSNQHGLLDIKVDSMCVFHMALLEVSGLIVLLESASRFPSWLAAAISKSMMLL